MMARSASRLRGRPGARGDGGSRTVVWTEDGAAFGVTRRPGHASKWERFTQYDLQGAPVAGAGHLVWNRDGRCFSVGLQGAADVDSLQFRPDDILGKIAAEVDAKEAADRAAELARIEGIEQRKRNLAAEAKKLEREAAAAREALV